MDAATESTPSVNYRAHEFRVGGRFCADAFPASRPLEPFFVRLRIGDWMRQAETSMHLTVEEARALADALQKAADAAEGIATAADLVAGGSKAVGP